MATRTSLRRQFVFQHVAAFQSVLLQKRNKRRWEFAKQTNATKETNFGSHEGRSVVSRGKLDDVPRFPFFF